MKKANQDVSCRHLNDTGDTKHIIIGNTHIRYMIHMNVDNLVNIETEQH